MWQEVVGRRSNTVSNWVERGAVRKFAEAIGDDNPLYYDEDAARRSRYGRLIAPPTFPITFDYGVIEGLTLPTAGLIHGSQTFEYNRLIYVGEEFRCYGVLENTFERSGRMGAMTFLVFSRIGEDDGGKAAFTMSATLIVSEAVKKGLVQ
jgi:acyl dehydratase